MSLENDYLHFNCLFKFASINGVIYLSFMSDADKDENATSKSAVLLPLFQRSSLFRTYEGKYGPIVSIVVKKSEKVEGDRSLDISCSNSSSDSDVLLHTVKIMRTMGIEWHTIPFERDITEAFNSALMKFLNGEVSQSESENNGIKPHKYDTKKLSNTKYACGLLLVLAVFLFIYNKFNSQESDRGILEPTLNVITVPQSHDNNPVTRLVPAQKEGTSPVSVNGESLTEYLKSAPSNAQVQKTLTTSFQDEDSVKQQVELNKQVLKDLNLPQGSDNDTGCFAGG